MDSGKVRAFAAKKVTTKIGPLMEFTEAHAAHQAYLEKNPNGYWYVNMEVLVMQNTLQVSHACCVSQKQSLRAYETLGCSLATVASYIVQVLKIDMTKYRNCRQTRLISLALIILLKSELPALALSFGALKPDPGVSYHVRYPQNAYAGVPLYVSLE